MGIVRTAVIAPVAIGKNDARKIRKIAEASLTPNHRTASGIQAMGEIGLSAWIRGFIA